MLGCSLRAGTPEFCIPVAFSLNLAKSLASKMISSVKFLVLITVWPGMSTFDDIFSISHLRIFFLCLLCFFTSTFTSILDDENVNFQFPSSNPRELMVSFSKTGFSPVDLGLIHLLCPFSNFYLFDCSRLTSRVSKFQTFFSIMFAVKEVMENMMFYLIINFFFL